MREVTELQAVLLYTDIDIYEVFALWSTDSEYLINYSKFDAGPFVHQAH